MRLQIDGSRLRLRLSEEQLALLLEGGRLDAALHCPNGASAGRTLVLDEAGSTPRVEGDLMNLRIRLPRDDFMRFAAERPRRDGFAFACSGIDASIDVDVRDSRRRLGASGGRSAGAD